MATVKPMLGDLELQQVQEIGIEGEQTLARHRVPLLEGDFLQGLGRRGSRVVVSGVLTGARSGEKLGQLRESFRAAETLPFVSDITAATRVEEVVIENMEVRDLAGKPERFAYAFVLREHTRPPATAEEEPPDITPPPPPTGDTGTLVVEVVAEGEAAPDPSRATVKLRGTGDDGAPLERTLADRSGSTWTEGRLPTGEYIVEAVASASAAATASATAKVQPGQTAQVTLKLGAGTTVAKTFVIHFRYNKAFIEPCMRKVLRNVAFYAKEHPSEKLLLVGHTDKVGDDSSSPPLYNQSLAERRARATYAYLTFGRDATGALAEWQALRRKRPAGEKKTVRDSWGTHEHQFMLQDLDYYPGDVDGKRGDLTDDAVRAFRCKNGLPPGSHVDDAVWRKLIRAYLEQDKLAIPEKQFFKNAGKDCDGGILEWLGCGEESPRPEPKPPKKRAWRPYRRVEMLFVTAKSLPCEITEPDTLNLPPPEEGGAPKKWCLGPGKPGKRCCFATREANKAVGGRWHIQDAEPRTIGVKGTIENEDGSPFAKKPFVVIAPDGTIKKGEDARGRPIAGRTDAKGSFDLGTLPAGAYSLTVRQQVLARLKEEGGGGRDARNIKGNVVCKDLRSAKDRLDVTIVQAPVLREIELPVVAHLMTALHPATREVRTCPDPIDANKRHPQATSYQEADLERFFPKANDIWRQARLRFALVGVVARSYANRVDCLVDTNEFAHILDQCAYPRVVNVFFFGELEGDADANTGGLYVPIRAGARGIVDGCAISERYKLLVVRKMDEAMAVHVLAHELGHFLSLEHVKETTANLERLMYPGAWQKGQKLGKDEVSRARASCNAALECASVLSLEVQGARQFGGSWSPHYLVLQKASGQVKAEARISPELSDPKVGKLEVTGGSPGANPRQRIVSTSTTGLHRIVAVYTPAAGGPTCIPAYDTKRVPRRKVTWAEIRVFKLTLEVAGALPAGGSGGGSGSTLFLAKRDGDPKARVEIKARIEPPPFCTTPDLVRWTNGNPTADPLRRVMPKSSPTVTAVTAEIPGTGAKKSREIAVVDRDWPTVTTRGSQILRGGKALRFFGTNAYYLLDVQARKCQSSGNFKDIAPQVSDFFALAVRSGIRVVRTWAFNDAANPVHEYHTQTQSGPNAKGLRALRMVIDEAERHGIYLVLTLANYWKDYGGILQYARWDDQSLDALENASPADAESFFYKSQKALTRYLAYAKRLIQLFGNKPNILAWELMNEPRTRKVSRDVLKGWIKKVAPKLRQAIGDRQLLGIGGVEDIAALEDLFKDAEVKKSIDLVETHLYPTYCSANYDKKTRLCGGGVKTKGNPKLDPKKSTEFLKNGMKVAKACKKPFYLGELGLGGYSTATSWDHPRPRPRAEEYESWASSLWNGGAAGLLFWQLLPASRPTYDPYEVRLEAPGKAAADLPGCPQPGDAAGLASFARKQTKRWQ